MYGVDHCPMLEDRICALDAELARLRAANARLRAECDAVRVFHRDIEPLPEEVCWAGASAKSCVSAIIAARRAVDEAGDLR